MRRTVRHAVRQSEPWAPPPWWLWVPSSLLLLGALVAGSVTR